MSVLETRTDENGFVHRRRRAKDGTTHWTIEVPVHMWNQFNGQGRGRDRAAAMLRVEDRKSKMRQAQHLHNTFGWAKRKIAAHLDVNESTVRHWLSTIANPEN